MAKKVLINVEEREVRIAILEDGQLVELYIESLDNKTILNNIYRGKIEGIVAGLNAAFVNIGFERNAFLHFNDIRSNMLLTPESKVDLEAYEAKCTEVEQKLELIEDADDDSDDAEGASQNGDESQQFGRRNNWRNKRDHRGRRDRNENRKSKSNGSSQENAPTENGGAQVESTTAVPQESASEEKPFKDKKRQRRDRRKHNKNRNENADNQMQDESFVEIDPELAGTRAAVNPFEGYMPYGKDNKKGRNGNRRNRGAKPTVTNENEWVAPAENENLPNDTRDSQQDFFGNVDIPTESGMAFEPDGFNEGVMEDNNLNKKKSKNKNKRRFNRNFRRSRGSNFAVRRKTEPEVTEAQTETEKTKPVVRKAKKTTITSTVKKTTATKAVKAKKTTAVKSATGEAMAETEKKKATTKKTKAVAKPETSSENETDKVASPKKATTAKKTTKSATATKKSAAKRADKEQTVTAEVSPITETVETAPAVTKATAKKKSEKAASTKKKSTKAVSVSVSSEAVAEEKKVDTPQKKTTRGTSKTKNVPMEADVKAEVSEELPFAETPVIEIIVEPKMESDFVEDIKDDKKKPAKKSVTKKTTTAKEQSDARANKLEKTAKKVKKKTSPEVVRPADIVISIDDVKPAEDDNFSANMSQPDVITQPAEVRSSENASISVIDVIGGKPSYPPKPKLHFLPVTQALQKGDEILVQVTKEEIGVKGARITSFVSLPGRYLVLMPNSEDEDAGGVSRKVNDFQERKRLKKVLRGIRRDIGDRSVGVIVRTAGVDREESEIRADADFLCTQWKEIQQVYGKTKAPALVYDDSDILHRLARDVFDDSITEIEIDDQDEGENLKAILKRLIPSLVDKVRIYDKPLNIFHHYGVEKQIQKAGRRKVWLKSGGYLIIDEAEALTAIDVNSGKFVGKDDQEKMILKTNLEAARAIARELRLRDIGGIIVCDFIDMKEMHNRETLLNEFRNILRRDRARTNVSGISEFGLVEMTRKRVRRSLRRTIFTDCPYCQGAGVVLNDAQIWLHIKHDIIGILNSSQCPETLEVLVNPRIKAYIDSNCHETLEEWKEEFGTDVVISKNDMLHIEHYAIDLENEEIDSDDATANDDNLNE